MNLLPHYRGKERINDMHADESFMTMDEVLSLPALLADLSNRCVQATTEQIDSAVDECQRLVCDYFRLDHSDLWQAYEEAADSLLLTHLYDQARCRREQPSRAAHGAPPCGRTAQRQDLPLRTNAKSFFPWIFDRARQGETVVISRLGELPENAVRDRDMLMRDGIRSIVVVPLNAGGAWLGLLAFGMNRETRPWTELEVKGFRVVGDIFANALTRIRADRALRENKLMLRLAEAGTAAELWTLHLASGEICLGEKGQKLLNLTPGERCDYERFLGHLHPEDRDRLRTALAEACETGVELSIEYRVAVSNGKFRWISSRWHPVDTSLGVTHRLMGVSLDVTELRESEEELRRSAAEIRELKERLKSESEYLRGEIKLNQRHAHVVGQSRGLKKVLQQVEQVAPVHCPVLISGESGTGKELIAQSLHRLSPRGNRLMITVNCAALPAGLIESELFGRERGAFTGALSTQAGAFEMADQSTIFLDEITELPLELQGKLLRVLQQGEYARLGNPKTRKVDVRVIAASNRNLVEEVRKQRFREDLYYRLSVFPITLPPLRERAEDIPLLVFAFLEELSSRMGKRVTKVPRRVMETLERHYWPGNIRELRNVIERGIILSSGDTLRASLSTDSRPATQPAVTLAEVERQHILATLEKTDWHIKGPHGAANILNLKAGTLYSRMRKLGVPHRRQKDGMPT